MGVTGLLKVLSPITDFTKISEFKGKRIAIDGYSWLHKGSYGCALELCKNIPTNQFVNYFVSRLKLLHDFGITPVVVFDGDRLPSKKHTEEERHKSRSDNLKMAQILEEKKQMAQAIEFYQKAVDVSPHMAHKVILELRKRNIAYVVAPYEADAQLAFLAREGIVDAVITEDSDLLAYQCPEVIVKLGKTGECQRIAYRDVSQSAKSPFYSFTAVQLVRMCVLVGCDYLANVHGVGIKKAERLVRDQRSIDRIVRALSITPGVTVPPNYAAEMERAELTFAHQCVFDPRIRKTVHLTPVSQSVLERDIGKDLDFLGKLLDDDVAGAIADGFMDPVSKEMFLMPVSTSEASRSVDKENIAPNRQTAGPAVKKVLSATSFSIERFLSSNAKSVENQAPSANKILAQSKAAPVLSERSIVPHVPEPKPLKKSRFFGGSPSAASQIFVPQHPSPRAAAGDVALARPTTPIREERLAPSEGCSVEAPGDQDGPRNELSSIELSLLDDMLEEEDFFIEHDETQLMKVPDVLVLCDNSNGAQSLDDGCASRPGSVFLEEADAEGTTNFFAEDEEELRPSASASSTVDEQRAASIVPNNAPSQAATQGSRIGSSQDFGLLVMSSRPASAPASASHAFQKRWIYDTPKVKELPAGDTSISTPHAVSVLKEEFDEVDGILSQMRERHKRMRLHISSILSLTQHVSIPEMHPS
eukprot:ANDGO_01484.mRNA.1 Exonuclease 1